MKTANQNIEKRNIKNNREAAQAFCILIFAC